MGIANNRPFQVFLWLGRFTLYRKFRGPALPRHQLLCYVQEWALLYLTKNHQEEGKGGGVGNFWRRFMLRQRSRSCL